MAIYTPARLAILGAGPIGLEAALYARFLGYHVVIYERGEVAETLRQAGDASLNTPSRLICTTLGLAALQAQNPDYSLAHDDATLTCRQWRERYLLPLAATDLLSDHFRLHTTVTAIDLAITEDGEAFRVQAILPSGDISVEAFDGILDCTGLAANPNWSPAEKDAEYFHVLGSKAQGTPEFEMTSGYDQIREAFAIIGDRATLDLYESSARLLRSLGCR